MPLELKKRKTASTSKPQTPRFPPSSPSSTRAPEGNESTQAKQSQTYAATQPSNQNDARGHTSASSSSQRPLEAAAILGNPRLREVTGLHPRKELPSWWSGMEPSQEELAQLQWALNLPDVFPVKRPRGNS
ncbi:hypothetical protein M426DRAFT_17064 [Hypoxylon sp. CI-4A]|nr:hypothetical protein M426DRAFT_17064 [Hypoxylon sp. CI-4A]